jgi:hypothetical protein
MNAKTNHLQLYEQALHFSSYLIQCFHVERGILCLESLKKTCMRTHTIETSQTITIVLGSNHAIKTTKV